MLERWGRDAQPLSHGLARDLDHLRNPRHRIDWETFAAFLGNLERLCTRAELEQLGADLLDVPSGSLPKVLTRHALSPWRFARLAAVFSSSVFPPVGFELRELGPTSFSIRLNIPADRPGAEPFFHVTRGHWRAIMTLIGHPDATIDTDIGSHHGHFVFRFAERRPTLRRLRELAGAAFAAPAWLREVYEERHQLRQAFVTMNRWRRDFHRVLDELQDAVVIHREGRILYANPALRHVVGRGDDKLVGSSLGDLFPSDELERALRSLETSGSDHARILSLTSALGTPLRFELRQRQDIEFDGGLAVLLVAQDVTEQMRMHERLLHADRMASLGMLAAGLAHEVNNPLGYILNSLQIMQRELGEAESAERIVDKRAQLEELVTVALEGTDQVRRIVSDLNGFSRSKSTTARSVDLRRSLAAALELAKPQLDDDIEVILELEPVPEIIASESRLSQVFLNLILNACHALRDKDEPPRRLWLRCFTDGRRRVVAEVQDDGVGIPKDARSKIFDPFFTTKPLGLGTGLGLAICRDVVTRLGGTIEVASRAGEGTTVCVAFPSLAEVVDARAMPH